MNIPEPGRKKALIVIDMQSAFLDPRNEYIVGNTLELLKTTQYDRYVVATFHAEKGSLWDKQQNWICPRGKDTQTVPEVLSALASFDPIILEKETRSVFKGSPDVAKILREAGIEEIHLIGTQTNDCVLATAFESFDLGFPTYVIEECCEGPTEELHKIGIQLLRRQNMTNRSML